MIYTAEEILNKHHYTRQDPECDMEGLIKIINEARIEAIKEAANGVHEVIDANGKFFISKMDILKLLDQIK